MSKQSPAAPPAASDESAPIVRDRSVVTAPPKVTQSESASIGRGRRIRNTKPYRTGWCGPGPVCNDGRFLREDGTPRYLCKAVSENGAKVTPRYLYCSCSCHQENPEAVQIDPAQAGTDGAAR